MDGLKAKKERMKKWMNRKEGWMEGENKDSND